jgi:hypothetical protein
MKTQNLTELEATFSPMLREESWEFTGWLYALGLRHVTPKLSLTSEQRALLRGENPANYVEAIC